MVELPRFRGQLVVWVIIRWLLQQGCRHRSPTETRSEPRFGFAVFERHRADLTERRMASTAVVEALDVVEDREPRIGLGTERASVEQLTFEGGEEALAESVVVAIADRAHRGASSHSRF